MDRNKDELIGIDKKIKYYKKKLKAYRDKEKELKDKKVE